jgi:hypothetical protein
MIVCADNPDDAQNHFECWLRDVPEGESPVQIEIKKVVAAQFLEQMLTEAGNERIDWLRISERVEPTLQLAEGDNEDPGYWADANQLVRPNQVSASLESLRTDLAEDIRSGLNWSAEKQFFFILSVLSPPLAQAAPDDAAEPSPFEAGDAPSESSSLAEASEFGAALPQLADKEVAALLQARNSVVAAWLWRKFAADTQYASQDIEIEPWCGLIVVDGENWQAKQF